MLDRTKHETTMRNILDEIYSHPELGQLLGFKGGTACYFFYHLPRFSTDLDFNLLNLEKKQKVFELLPQLLNKYTKIKDQYIKTNTIFYYLIHTPQRSGIKIEISTREIEKINSYQLIEFYGTSMLIMKPADIFANKLLALAFRHSATSRDLYDINFFFKQNWEINNKIIEKVTDQKFIEYLKTLPDFIQNNFNHNNIHLGLGELLDNESQRNFIKSKLITDTINHIKFYIDSTEKQKHYK